MTSSIEAGFAELAEFAKTADRIVIPLPDGGVTGVEVAGNRFFTADGCPPCFEVSHGTVRLRHAIVMPLLHPRATEVIALSTRHRSRWRRMVTAVARWLLRRCA